jgi:hypothetical protein
MYHIFKIRRVSIRNEGKQNTMKLQKIIYSTIFLFGISCDNSYQTAFQFPPIHSSFKLPPMEYAKLSSLVRNYVIDKAGSKSNNGKVFCSYEILGVTGNDNNLSLYINALIQEYYHKDNMLIKGAGSFLPIALSIAMKNSGYQILKCEIPRDGPDNWKDCKRIFPKAVLNKVRDFEYGGIRVGKLMDDIEEQVENQYSQLE